MGFASHEAAGFVAVADEEQTGREFVSLGRLDRNGDFTKFIPHANEVSVLQAQSLDVLGSDLQGVDFGLITLGVLTLVEGRSLLAGSAGDEDEGFGHDGDTLKEKMASGGVSSMALTLGRSHARQSVGIGQLPPKTHGLATVATAK